MFNVILVVEGNLFLYVKSVLHSVILRNGRVIIRDEVLTFNDQREAFANIAGKVYGSYQSSAA